MIRDDWMHVGGAQALCEGGLYPPGSRLVTPQVSTGETCGSVFWCTFNQRLHRLYPDREAYVAEIEKSIWNVLLANHRGAAGSAYHTHLEGTKQGKPRPHNTCCEGQATRLVGSLPEYIYSLADDGIFVNLYEPSSIAWEHDGQRVALEMKTGFPEKGDVVLTVSHQSTKDSAAVPTIGVDFSLNLRIPCWATRDVGVRVNGEVAATGAPGCYLTIDRDWQDGDTVEFDLPMGFRVTEYDGMDHILKTQYTGLNRVSVEYGPFLMAVVGHIYEDRKTKFADYSIAAVLNIGDKSLSESLVPSAEKPLHFEIDGHPEYMLIPYWQVPVEETFTCFPVVV